MSLVCYLYSKTVLFKKKIVRDRSDKLKLYSSCEIKFHSLHVYHMSNNFGKYFKVFIVSKIGRNTKISSYKYK